MTTLRQGMGLAVSIVACFGAAALGSILTTPSLRDWYVTLQKPSWTPPNWIFGPVWSALYLSMAIAAWIVWRTAEFRGAKPALTLFAVQLGLNVCWPALFFTLHWPGLAFAEIVLLWLMILLTLIAFWPVSRAAAWLMAPYLAWVTFAAVLNFAIWKLNA